MALSLPDHLNVRTISNRGIIPIPCDIIDVATVQDVLQSDSHFVNDSSLSSVATLAAELMKRKEEGFLGTFSVMFRFQPPQQAAGYEQATGHTIEMSLMVVSRRRKGIQLRLGPEKTIEDVECFVLNHMMVLCPEYLEKVSPLMEGIVSILSIIDSIDIKDSVSEIVHGYFEDVMYGDLYDEWERFIGNLCQELASYARSLSEPLDVEVTVYWQAYESVVELPTMYEVITLHHSSSKRNWYGKKKTRHWTTTHFNPRGYRLEEIERVRLSLVQGIETLKNTEAQRIQTYRQGILDQGSQPAPTVYLWCCNYCRYDFYRLLQEDYCHRCGTAQSTWRCSVCDKDNPLIEHVCCFCGNSISPAQADSLITEGWSCTVCLFSENACNQLECNNPDCRSPRSMYSFPLLAGTRSRIGRENHSVDETGDGFHILDQDHVLDESKKHISRDEQSYKPSLEAIERLVWVCCNEPKELTVPICNLCGGNRMTWTCGKNEFENNIWDEQCQCCGQQRPTYFVTHHILQPKAY